MPDHGTGKETEEEIKMACFLVPAAEAAVVTAAAQVVKMKEKKKGTAHMAEETAIPFSRKLQWLCNLLWGGALLLAFEHLWHGEVVPWFPFLTAASDPAETAVMLSEMSTVGVTMAVLVTAVWVGMLVVCNVLLKRARKQAGAAK